MGKTRDFPTNVPNREISGSGVCVELSYSVQVGDVVRAG